MCDYKRFLDFYGNNKGAGACNGKAKAGDQYVCPSPSIGGPFVETQYPQPVSPCSRAPNMGVPAHCPRVQQGGGAGLMYDATGSLTKGGGCGCQGGGAALARSDMYYADLARPKIGRRPVYAHATELAGPQLGLQRGAFLNRAFNCRQPFWDRKCM